MVSDNAAEKARQFLEIADQFRLGDLITEASHPRTRNLSETAKKEAAAGLEMLFDVDKDVVEKYREWAHSGEAGRIGRRVAEKLAAGGKIFFTGCGATGRLSIQLAAIWRDYWQKRGAAGDFPAATAGEWEQRAFSVMAGGDFALIKSVEGFEDYAQFGRKQIDELGVGEGDVVFAISEGGETSFVIGTAWQGLEKGAQTYFVYNNPDDVLCEHVERSRELIQEPAVTRINLTTGPMAITGSTRLQATSIQLCVMVTLLEIVLEHLSGRLAGGLASEEKVSKIPAEFLRALEEVQATLQSRQVREQVAALVEKEEEIYRRKQRNNYFADSLAIDVLTDTTERSPTFCIPAFKKFDDTLAAESWSFLFLPHRDTPSAWRGLLKRDLQPVEWEKETIRELIGEADLERQDRIMQSISGEEILRFRIGMDGLPFREIREGDSATAIVAEEEISQLIEADGFYRQQLEQAHAKGGLTAVIFFGRPGAIRDVEDFLAQWPVPASRVLVPLPDISLPLNGATRIGAKMLLNALSTCTMVRLGRVMGNVMIWVVPSNLKLIDRSIRYIRLFTQLDYGQACLLLHQAVEYVSPRMKAGKEYPSTVGLCVIAHREKCGFEEAETKLYLEV